MKGHHLPSSPAAHDVERLVEVFRALADPTRLRLVLRLSHDESNVAGLVAALDLPQSTVSRHLAVLRAAQLVRSERRGTSVVYRLAGAHLRDLLLEAYSHAEHEREEARQQEHEQTREDAASSAEAP